MGFFVGLLRWVLALLSPLGGALLVWIATLLLPSPDTSVTAFVYIAAVVYLAAFFGGMWVTQRLISVGIRALQHRVHPAA